MKIKQFFKNIWGWLKDHAPTRRRIVQLYVALLYNANIKGFINASIYTGKTKYACLPGFNCYSCPGAIGTCPLGALQNSLESANTRTPYYVLGCIMLFGLICGRAICGWLCPVGLLQEFAYKAKTPKVKKSKWTRVASYLKYVILAVFVITIPIMYSFIGAQIPAFCKYICPVGTFEGSLVLMFDPANMADMGPLFTWKFSVLMVFIVCSMFFYRFFCRFFCPLGAIYGFFNKIALFGIEYDPETCTNCGLCLDKCKMDIKHVGDHECISCGECLPVCPVNAIKWKGDKFFLAPNAIETPLPEKKINLGEMVTKQEPVTSESEISIEPIKHDRIRPEMVAKNPKPKTKLKKGWAIGIGVAMTVALASALVYYNFILKDEEGFEVGMHAPDASFDLIKSNGAMIDEPTTWTISEHYGTPTILNFWYTECQPCKAEMPEFREFYNKYSTDLDLIIIDAGDTRQECYDYISEPNGGVDWNSMNMDFAMDYDCEYSKKYNPTGYPLTIVLDGEGSIVGIENHAISISILEDYATKLGIAK